MAEAMDRAKLEAAITAARMSPQLWGATDPFGKNLGSAGFVNLRDDYAKALAAAAKAHLATLPATKMVEVWRVEWAYSGMPHCSGWPSREAAERDAEKMRVNANNTDGRWACIRVTGPHQQEVPA